MLRPGIRRLMGLDLPRGDAIAAELEDELRHHLDLRVEQLAQQGVPRDAALVQARERYGEIDAARRDIHRHATRRGRSIRRTQWVDNIVQDTRLALRTLSRQKGWTAVAVLTLALGIGANTAVFSVVNDLIVDPLRYPDADRLVVISRVNAKSGLQLSPNRQLRETWASARSFEGLQGVATADRTLSGQGEPRTVHANIVEPSFFAFAGARMLVGRPFRDADAAKGAAPVVAIDELMWRERYAGSSDVVGKTLVLDGKSFSIVGVVPAGVRVPAFSAERADVWLPFTSEFTYLSGPVVGRLARGVSTETARAELDGLAKARAKEDHMLVGTQLDVSVVRPGSKGQARQSILMLASAVTLLLLIACANVAHLLLARGAARQREMAIRAALGAGAGRIIGQLLTESLLLAGAGGIAGLAVGVLGLRLIVAFRPPMLADLVNAHVDGRVLAITVIVSALTGIAFGLTAGVHGIRSSAFSVLRASVGGTAGRGRGRLRSLLVVTEMALSAILLVGATLFIRTVVNLHRIDPGFDPANVYAMTVALPEARYPSAPDRDAYAVRLLEAAQRIPGMAGVTVSANVPARAGLTIGRWEAEGSTPQRNGGGLTATNTILPNYFALMRMPLTAGHTFDARSLERNEVVVSQSLARQLWSNAYPIGKRLRMASAGPDRGEWNTVVGVVADASLLSLRDERNTPAIYYPSKTGAGYDGVTLVARTAPGQSPYAALRRLSVAVDPALPPPTPLRVTDLLMQTIAMQRFLMTLLSLFAILAVCLSAIGLYGVIAYAVSQTTREIGVRIALGAARRDIARLVMRQGVALAAVGLAIGLVGAVWGMRIAKSSLFGVTALDPLSYVVGAVILLGIAVLACAAPTARALRVDPLIAMRSD